MRLEKMEEIFENPLKDLKEKFKWEETSFDSVDMEKCLREFKTELYIKRDQVKQLRNDLENATTEIKELKKALELSTKSLDEKQFSLNVLTKKFRSTEDELMEKIDALSTIQMQHKLMVVELDKIKDILQKTETEKSDLSRKLEVFETKQRQSFIYHNQILKRETNLKSTIDEVQEMIRILKIEQSEVIELSKQTRIAEDSMEKIRQISKNYEVLKKEKEYYEEMYIKINAKHEMLQELLSLREDIQEPNLVSKIIFNQWKANRDYYQQQQEENNDILNKLSDLYNDEKSINSKLIEKNDVLTEDNNDLKSKINKLEETYEQNTNNLKNKIEELKKKLENVEDVGKVDVKNEPIQIDD